MVKRIFDLFFSFMGMIILSPFFLLIGILIKLDSPGSIFYQGLRIGKSGKPFNIYKFRSMAPNSAKPGGDTTALNDPRITRIGAFLRKYKFDELPQLFNIIKGDMSFVGPRPELAYYTNQYNDTEKCILSVRPGITDLSSIQFNSLDHLVGAENADNIFEEKILPIKNKLRVKYVKEQSLWLDIKIIFKTIWIIIFKIFKG